MKDKRILLLYAVIAIIIIWIVAINVNSNKNNTNQVNTSEGEQTTTVEEQNGLKVNKSEKMKENKKYKGLEFSNIQFVTNEEKSTTEIYADITNTTKQDMNEQSININILDKDGNILNTFTGTIGELKAGETKTLTAAIAAVYDNAYNIEIVDAKK